jgi:hypothetical protein
MTKLVALGASGPPPPEFWAACWTVMMAPMDGSGERITVLLAAQGSDNAWRLEYTLRPETLTALFKDNAPNQNTFIEMVGHSLLSHIEHEPISTWQPPLSGFHVSEPFHVGETDLIAVLRIAKVARSFLACPGCYLPVDPDQPVRRCWQHVDLADFKPRRKKAR